MKCAHCGYIDETIPQDGVNVVTCPQCGAKNQLDIAKPVNSENSSTQSTNPDSPELKVAKAVHVGFGDFAGNLAANVTIASGTQKYTTSSQSKISLEVPDLTAEGTETHSTRLTTDDMLLGLDTNEELKNAYEETNAEVDDVYTKIQRGFDERQKELDEREEQLKHREENIHEQEKHLEEEIKLNRESAEDYLKAKKMYESQGDSPDMRTTLSNESEKQTPPGYLHALLRVFAGVSVLLLIILLCLVFALNKASKQITALRNQILTAEQVADSPSPLLLQMRADYQALQNQIEKNAETIEQANQQILAMEVFLEKYEHEDTLSGMTEILTVELRLANCKNLRQSFELQQPTLSRETDK